jgi:hypothetical protein
MNRILLLALGLLLFGCDTPNQTKENESSNAETIKDESVEIGSGNEISPQLEGVEDSATRMKVDTINSANEARERE